MKYLIVIAGFALAAAPATAQTVVKRTVTHTTTTHSSHGTKTVCRSEWHNHRRVSVCHKVSY